MFDRISRLLHDLFLRPNPAPRPSIPPPSSDLFVPPRSAPVPTLLVSRSVRNLINDERFKVGLVPLRGDPLLDSIAADWARHLARSGALAHGNYADRIWSAHPNTAAGEVIAAGQATPEAVVAAWMAHPPHRDILMGGYDLIGVGSAAGADGVIYWVADLDQD
jgi:uncharacterized protein YkwD